MQEGVNLFKSSKVFVRLIGCFIYSEVSLIIEKQWRSFHIRRTHRDTLENIYIIAFCVQGHGKNNILLKPSLA